MTYSALAKDAKSEQDKLEYYDIANSIYEWSAKTYFSPENGYDDEEW
jgi:hypothetical protein